MTARRHPDSRLPCARGVAFFAVSHLRLKPKVRKAPVVVRRCAFFCLSVVLCLFAAEQPARAQSAPLTLDPPAPNGSLWRTEWPEFRTSEGVLTAVSALTVGALLIAGPLERPHWQGGILFDDAVRNQIRGRSAHTRHVFRRVGDYTYRLSPVLPLLDVVIAAVGYRDAKLARNLALLTLEAYSYTGGTYFAATEIFGRARPDSQCDVPGGTCDTQSFYGGHAAISATGAGLVCANHTRLALFGNPVLDAAACALAATNALLTGTTRMVADRHYASDILVGTGLGFGFGYGVPVLLHYSYGKKSESISIGPDPNCGPDCLGVHGTF